MKSRGVQGARVPAVRLPGRVVRHAMFGIVMFFAPVSAVVYWLAIPEGAWVAVAAAQLAVAVFCALGIVCACRTAIWVVPSGIIKRGFFGRMGRFATEDVTRIVMLDLYQRDSLETHPQLFVIGLDGRLLLRMRGQFWSIDDVQTIAEGFDVPITRVPEPMTVCDLNYVRPEWLYWFERRVVSRPS